MFKRIARTCSSLLFSKVFFSSPIRQCASHPASDCLHQSDTQGLTPRVVVDLHKFLAMQKMLNTESLTVEQIDGLQTVTGLTSSSTPRVNLLVRSCGPLRPGSEERDPRSMVDEMF